MTALHEASQRGHSEVVQILLEHHADFGLQDMVNVFFFYG